MVQWGEIYKDTLFMTRPKLTILAVLTNTFHLLSQDPHMHHLKHSSQQLQMVRIVTEKEAEDQRSSVQIRMKICLTGKPSVGFPGGCGKESTCQCRRCKFNPWVRKMPWRREWQPAPVFLPGKFHEQRSLACCSTMGSQRVGHDWVTEH